MNIITIVLNINTIIFTLLYLIIPNLKRNI